MRRTKNNKKKQKRNIRQLRPEKLLLLAFCLSCVFYCFSKIGLNSYNITLSVEDQRLASELAETQDEVHTLKTDISSIQDKNKMLGIVEDELTENQDNIYVINN